MHITKYSTKKRTDLLRMLPDEISQHIFKIFLGYAHTPPSLLCMLNMSVLYFWIPYYALEHFPKIALSFIYHSNLQIYILYRNNINSKKWLTEIDSVYINEHCMWYFNVVFQTTSRHHSGSITSLPGLKYQYTLEQPNASIMINASLLCHHYV